MKYPVPIILASNSPRRRQMLSTAGISVEVVPAGVSETARTGETPDRLVRRLAATKAITVAVRIPDSMVIGADTVVALGRNILGKPCNPEEARAMLALLSGKRHQVYTGVAVYREASQRGWVTVEVAEVGFRELDPAEIDAYVATGDPLDKAGGYGIQGSAGNWVVNFSGNLETVVGLPIDAVRRLLDRATRVLTEVGHG